jgi:protein-arginine kinase activator protein McsA
MIKPCERCGAEYEAKGPAKHCPTCRKELHAEYGKKYRKAHPETEEQKQKRRDYINRYNAVQRQTPKPAIGCAECNKTFVPTSRKKMYCSAECYHAAQNRKRAERYERQKLKALRAARNPGPRLSITEVAVEARKQGMSYGEYVWRMSQ